MVCSGPSCEKHRVKKRRLQTWIVRDGDCGESIESFCRM